MIVACAKPVGTIRRLASRFGGRGQVGKRSCSSKSMEREDDSKKSHHDPA
jgi:hypothetical protein